MAGTSQNNSNFIISRPTVLQIVLVKANGQESILGNVTFNTGETIKNFPITLTQISFGNKIKVKRLSGELSYDGFSDSFNVLNYQQIQNQSGGIA